MSRLPPSGVCQQNSSSSLSLMSIAEAVVVCLLNKLSHIIFVTVLKKVIIGKKYKRKNFVMIKTFILHVYKKN